MRLFTILTDKPTGKKPLGSPRRGREDNVIMDLKEIGINTRNWVTTVKDGNDWRVLVNAGLTLRVP